MNGDSVNGAETDPLQINDPPGKKMLTRERRLTWSSTGVFIFLAVKGLCTDTVPQPGPEFSTIGEQSPR